jgi:hypothetical protein
VGAPRKPFESPRHTQRADAYCHIPQALDWRKAERQMGFGTIFYNHELGYIAGDQIGLSLTDAEEEEFASGAIGFTGLSAA